MVVAQALSIAIQPRNAPTSLKLLGQLVDDVWAVAGGDKSTDYNYYTKRGLLAGCVFYLSLFIHLCMWPWRAVFLLCFLSYIRNKQQADTDNKNLSTSVCTQRVHIDGTIHAHRLHAWIRGHVAGVCFAELPFSHSSAASAPEIDSLQAHSLDQRKKVSLLCLLLLCLTNYLRIICTSS